MKALIDADILVYRVGFTTNDVSEHIAIARMDESIGGILSKLGTNDYTSYLTTTAKDNFRYAIYQDYKNTPGRKVPKPIYYDILREYITSAHNGLVVTGHEADDQMGIDQTPDTIICSIDKDLNQIPGWHYHFVKDVKYEVKPADGLKFFYLQLLTGDKAVDNIPGLRGIGMKTAEKILAGLSTEEDLFNATKKKYQEHYPDSWESTMLRNGQLLKICTYEGERWQFPEKRIPITDQVSNTQ